MTQPTKPTAPLPALRSDPDTFSARLEANILFWPTHLTFIDESNTFNAGLSAALVAGNLPPLTGNELDAVRVNAAADGVEFVDVTAAGWTFLAATTPAAQRAALELAAGALAAKASIAEGITGTDDAKFMTALTARAGSKAQYGTLATTTSGTAFDFTGIPAGVSEVKLVLQGVSLSGTDNFLIQLGTATGIVATGYESSASTMSNVTATLTSTAGLISRISDATVFSSMVMTITRINTGSNFWVASYTGARNTALTNVGGGEIDLGAELTQLRLTRTGSNTFDAGTANISWRY